MQLQLSLPGRRFKLPVEIKQDGGRLELKYGFCTEMNAEVKAMAGAKYHGYEDPPRKCWTIADHPRNWFTLKYLAGENVFSRYDAQLINFPKDQYPSAFPHQPEGAADVLTRGRKILAWEMGTCKTYTMIMAMEQSGFSNWWWIGTKGSLREMSREFRKWNSKVMPVFMTYDELKKVCVNWSEGMKPPRGIVFDEASKIKSPTSQRSEAAQWVSVLIEQIHSENGIVVLMSGTPSPKDPADWWHLCEVAKPGFLREGSYQAFKKRLSLTISKQGQYGVYPELVTWWDDENKCATCGQYEDKNAEHDIELAVSCGKKFHQYTKSVNEIQNLYERMKGLVSIKFKREVLKHLPEKIWHYEKLTPLPNTLRAAKTILNTAKSTVVGLTLLRELSDGFQYIDVPDGLKLCPMCEGRGNIIKYYSKTEPDMEVYDVQPENYGEFTIKDIVCTNCEGKKQVTNYVRGVKEVPCPKDDYFIDLLENHEDVGRFICFAGFTGSIDRCVNTAHKQGWATIRIDARGWHATDYNGVVINVKDLYDPAKGDPYLQMFQDDKDRFPRVCVVGHPKSGGMGLTLTASPGLYWYGLVFDGEDYMQGCDRGHRPGMDLNRGFTIYNAEHLPTDKLMLENLQKKIDLQNMSLGSYKEALDSTGERIT